MAADSVVGCICVCLCVIVSCKSRKLIYGSLQNLYQTLLTYYPRNHVWTGWLWAISVSVIASILPTESVHNIYVHSVTATFHLVADKHRAQCSSGVHCASQPESSLYLICLNVVQVTMTSERSVFVKVSRELSSYNTVFLCMYFVICLLVNYAVKLGLDNEK